MNTLEGYKSSQIEIEKMLAFLKSQKTLKESEQYQYTFLHENGDMIFLGNDRIVWQRYTLQIPIYFLDDLECVLAELNSWVKPK